MSTIKQSAMILAWIDNSFTYSRYHDLRCCRHIPKKIKLIKENGKFINLDHYVRRVNQGELEAIAWRDQKKWEAERAAERYGWSYKHNLTNGRYV